MIFKSGLWGRRRILVQEPQWILFCLALTLSTWSAPGVCLSQFENLEADARTVPWTSITRLALEAGFFPPAYRPVSQAELADLLDEIQYEALGGDAPALAKHHEYTRLLWLQHRYRGGAGGGGFHGCSWKDNTHHLRLSGRVVGGYSELGNPVPFEGGLSFAAGHNIFFEPVVEFAYGKFWAALDFRLGGRWAPGGVDFSWAGGSSDPLTWPDWSRPTGRATMRDARLKGGSWTGQTTRALVGMQLGNWALSAGWDHRRSGPGLTGGMNLDYQGQPFPAFTVRRTSSFLWSGFMTHLAPDQTLLRAGLLSKRTVTFNDIYGQYAHEANPWFFQWLVGWNITSWFRTQFTHTVMATPREGTLWPDLLQINFPVIGTTWREGDSGPITDRIFAVQLEFRWRDAPWPLLPSSAGRVFWDYGGTDFLPSGPGGLVPQISIPASVAGFELLSPSWDLGFEYAEFQHDKVLWYSNGGYREGYTQQLWLMGHPLGGSGECFTGLVRIRPPKAGFQVELQGRLASWGMHHYTPGTGELYTVALTLGRTPRAESQVQEGSPSSPLLWEITAEWNREGSDPLGFLDESQEDSEATRDWWRLFFKMGF